jgi:hypothetical protein
MSFRWLRVLVVTGLLGMPFAATSSQVSAAGINLPCKKAGVSASAKSKGKTVRVKCSKVGKKLRWVQVKGSSPAITSPVRTVAPPSLQSVTTTPVPRVTPVPAQPVATLPVPTTLLLVGTVSQRNATSKAASYLRSSAFSRSGLIEQLIYEGFSLEDSTYGVDAQNADWNTQAVKKAASYLRTSAFSRSGLIAQLEYEDFSNSEAIHGVDAQAADWNAQAAKKAASYLRSSSFSRTGLISQLRYEGFSQSEAEYGVSTTGL